MADKVQIELEVIAKKALESVEKFTKDAQGKLSTINISTFATGVSSVLSLASKAFDVFGGVVKSSVGAAIEAEQATQALANSMRLVGDFSESAVKGFEEYASALSLTSKASDDQVLAALALAKSFQLTNKEAKNVVNAATELAAITGDSLDSAVQKLAKSYGGTLSREIKQLIPELRVLTREQLANGEAIRIVTERFGGSAEAATKTFGGSVSQLTKAFGELSEEIGRSVTENKAITSSIQKTTEQTNALTEALSLSKLGFKDFVNAFFQAETSGDKTFFALLSKSAKKAVDDSKLLLTELEKIKLAQGEASNESAIDKKIKADRARLDFQEKAEAAFQAVKTDLEKAGLDDIEKINLDAQRKIQIIRDAALAENIFAVKNQERLIGAVQIDRAKAVAEKQLQLRQQYEASEAKFDKEARDRIQNALAKPIEQALKLVVGAELDGKELLSIGAGLLNVVNKGAAGASEFVSKAIGAAADSLLPGIGAAVSEIVNILAQGPEKVKETIEAFVKAIPQVIDNIIDAFPVLIETLARELPPVIAKIAPVIAQRFAIELVKNMPTIVRGFADGLVEAAKQFVQAIFDNIKSVGGLLSTSGGSSGGGVGGTVVRAAKAVATFGLSEVIGFAEGGRIPDLPQFSGDRFPAKLSAGEQILSRDLSSKLDAFLSGAQGSTPTVVQINIGQREMARVLLDLNRNGFRTA
jgi:hypothetical protein